MSAKLQLCRTAIWLLGAGLAAIAAPARAAQQSSVVPQTTLSVCPDLTVTNRESVTAGTHLAVSPDGRLLAELIQTNVNAQVKLRQLDAGTDRTIALDPPALPPGIIWQVSDMQFSAAGDLLVIRGVGALWAVQTSTAQVLYQIGAESKPMAFPGQFSIAGRQLAASFWPPESYLADALTTKPVEVRFYDAANGQILSRVALALGSSNNWSVLRLSPDGKWLAVLLRATHWPGKARLILFASDTGKALWEKRISAEDIAWLGNGSMLLALGDHLAWLTQEKGDEVQATRDRVRSSEFQQIRLSEAARLVAGQFQQFSPLRRALGRSYPHDKLWRLWRLGTGEKLCDVKVDRATDLNAWLTSAGEVIALEDSYEVRGPLRLLRSSRVVTYKVAPPEENAEAGTKPKQTEKPKAGKQ